VYVERDVGVCGAREKEMLTCVHMRMCRQNVCVYRARCVCMLDVRVCGAKCVCIWGKMCVYAGQDVCVCAQERETCVCKCVCIGEMCVYMGRDVCV